MLLKISIIVIIQLFFLNYISFAQNEKWIELKRGEKKEAYFFNKEGFIYYHGAKINNKIETQDLMGSNKIIVPEEISICYNPKDITNQIIFWKGKEFNKVWLFSVINNSMVLLNLPAHYGVSKFVKFSPSRQYIIFHDPEGEELISYNVTTRNIEEIPLWPNNWSRKFIENFNMNNSQESLYKADLYRQMDENSFEWIGNNDSFYVNINISSNNKKGITRTYTILSILPLGKIIQLY